MSRIISIVIVFLVIVGVAHAELVSHWSFNEGSGIVAQDSTGFLDLTLYNMEWVVGDSAPGGGGSGSINFPNGHGASSGYRVIQVPDTLYLLKDFTFSIWVKLRSVSNDYHLALWGGGSYSNSAMQGKLMFEINSDPSFLPPDDQYKLYFNQMVGIEGFDQMEGPLIVSNKQFGSGDLNQWVHIAVTYDSSVGANGEAKIYINNTLDSTHAMSEPFTLEPGPATLGTWQITTYDYFGRIIQGQLDEVAWFDTALDATDINTLYTSGVASVPHYSTPDYCGKRNHVYDQGDINSDCFVDFFDFAELADQWMMNTDPNQT